MLSAHEIARTAHCSPATVVRFAQSLGYSGYPHMQRVVRSSHRPPAFGPELSVESTPGGDDVDRAFAAERGILDAARHRFQGRGLAPLVLALRDRSPLILAGESHARPVLSLFEDRLARSGRAVVSVTSLDCHQRAWFDALGPRSGVIAVAFGRETRVAEAAVAAAGAAGVPAVVLIDSTVSALARSPLARVVPSEGREGPSLVAMVAVAQALAAGLARREAAPRLAALIA